MLGSARTKNSKNLSKKMSIRLNGLDAMDMQGDGSSIKSKGSKKSKKGKVKKKKKKKKKYPNNGDEERSEYERSQFGHNETYAYETKESIDQSGIMGATIKSLDSHDEEFNTSNIDRIDEEFDKMT